MATTTTANVISSEGLEQEIEGNNNNININKEEWKFIIYVPSTIPVVSVSSSSTSSLSQTNTTTTSNTTSNQMKPIEMSVMMNRHQSCKNRNHHHDQQQKDVQQSHDDENKDKIDSTRASATPNRQDEEVEVSEDIVLGGGEQQTEKSKKIVIEEEELRSLIQTENTHNNHYSSTSKSNSTSSKSNHLLLKQTGGWILTSPYWSIRSSSSSSTSTSSSILCSITYCHAYQSIPEYTKIATNPIMNMVTKLTCCCTSDQISYQPKYYTKNYTVNDIIHMYQYDQYYIPNIGICQAIHIHLKPFIPFENDDDDDGDDDDNEEMISRNRTLFPYLQALRQHLIHIETNQKTQDIWKHNHLKTKKKKYKKKMKKHDQKEKDQLKNHEDTTADGTTSTTTKATGPILIFALPYKQMDTPLLYKLILPKKTVVTSSSTIENLPLSFLKSLVSIHTISVLDGQLLSSSSLANSSSSNSNSNIQSSLLKHDHDVLPTHIYINGWQSWSYSGTIKKGDKQPTSALPNLYSRAFNYGGSKPPTLSKSSCYQSDFFTCITSSQLLSASMSASSLAQQQQPIILDEMGGPALILGWLSQHEQYGIITINNELNHYQMYSSCHGQILISFIITSSSSVQKKKDHLHVVDKNDIITVIKEEEEKQQHDDHVDNNNIDNDTTAHNDIHYDDYDDPTCYLYTDWVYIQLISSHSYDEEPMVQYLHNVSEMNHARPLQNGNILTGWCSWYVFYEHITANMLRQNIQTLSLLQKSYVSTNVTIIDDGYMTAWGDWDSFKPNAFPKHHQLSHISNDITEHNMRPGLWLAPYCADKHSIIVKQHPDWIIRNDKGIPSNSSNCGKFFYGLDATNPAVRQYVYQCIYRAVHIWNFNVLKIDFLYAACLEGNGKYDISMSRAQTMHLALETIRQAAGTNAFLIGCGCPISSGIGYVDAMRISADTGPTWYPSFPLPYWDYGTLPSLRAMIRNSISRAPLGHRWWHNDPDCIMLGQHTKLTNEEIASAATIVAMTCGMLLLSDDLPKVNPSRMIIISKIFPLTGVSAVVLDLHSTNDGLPSLLRLWCTDRYSIHDSFYETTSTSPDNNNNVNRNNRDDDDDNSSNSEDRKNQYQTKDDGGTLVDDYHNHVDILSENYEATYFGRQVSFMPGEDTASKYIPSERKRSCIHVTDGLGTWTVVSISNWSDQPKTVTIPPLALLPPPSTGWDDDNISNDNNNLFNIDNKNKNNNRTSSNNSNKDTAPYGYHVFAFWSCKYSWIPYVLNHSNGDACTSSNIDDPNHHDTSSYSCSISKRLLAHETEVYHIKEVIPDIPQYIGSSIHFSCGQEVRTYHVTSNCIMIQLKTNYERNGNIYLFIPRQNIENVIRITSIDHNNKEVHMKYQIVGNTPIINQDNGSPRLLGRIIQVPIIIYADNRPHDGQFKVEF